MFSRDNLSLEYVPRSKHDDLKERQREEEREEERQKKNWLRTPNHPARIFLREIRSAAKDLPDAIPPVATYINLEKLIP